MSSQSAQNLVNGNSVFVKNCSPDQGDRIEDGKTSKNEPVAITGMGCRLPGSVSSPSLLWDLLIQGRSGQSKTPASRFNATAFPPPNTTHAGGYFIEDNIRLLENDFFGINNVEAMYMDAQQRKLLEVVFECFESAGVTLEDLSGANVGCYVANFTADYQIMQSKDPESYHRYSATGMGPTILANRISHVFNLQGPSFVLDTACSSSLYCLHLACTALDAGECDAAIVAGANLIQTPEVYLGAVEAGVISSTSICHTFDTSADGYGRAEGVGALFLKRLSHAIRDRDPVRSVIRGTAVNSSGKTNGITLPSAEGQEAVIRKAYAKAGLTVDETDYVEAHGTGTPVGDPIEVDAISRVFHHRSDRPTLIGSVKTNLGHSEAVSGISSIIKVTLALEQGLIPATIGIKDINPSLKLEERRVKIVTEITPWPQTAVPRASINSFGYGGANAHAILEAACAHVPPKFSPYETTEHTRSSFLLPFSAHTEQSLTDRVTCLANLPPNDLDLARLAYTLGCRRSKLSTRGYIVAHKNSLEADLQLESLRTLNRRTSKPSPPIAFVFTGQGGQWPKMGLRLMEEFPSYNQTIRDLDNFLMTLPNPPTWTIEDVIKQPAKTSSIHRASHSQPICTAIQIALVELLREWGITPKAVVGHSSGEIGAAFAASHLTAHEAIKIAYYRGLVVTNSVLKGAMMAVALGKDFASQAISKAKLDDQINVACVNSPENVTISGDYDAIEEIFPILHAQGIFTRKLKTDDMAYHSHHMRKLGHDYESLLLDLQSRSKSDDLAPPSIQMFSSVTPQRVEPSVTRNPAYWRLNMEAPVLFNEALQALLSEGNYYFIEIGPHPVLKLPIKQIQQSRELPEHQSRYSETLIRGEDCIGSMLKLAGNLFLQGYNVNFSDINQEGSSSCASSPRPTATHQAIPNLPCYKWHYGHPLWHEPRSSYEYRNRHYPGHELLGSRISGASAEIALWRNVIRVKDIPWLSGHRLGQTVVFPAAGYLAIAIEALHQASSPVSEHSSVSFRQVNLVAALALLIEDNGVEISTHLELARISGMTCSHIWWQFYISSFTEGISTVHANGLIGFESMAQLVGPRVRLCDENFEELSSSAWYDKLAEEGLNFGSDFQTLSKIRTDRRKKLSQASSTTRVIQKGSQTLSRKSYYMLHPITLDAMLQTAVIATAAGTIRNLRAKVPITMGQIRILLSKLGTGLYGGIIRANSKQAGFGTAIINAELDDLQGNTLALINDVRATDFQEGITHEKADLERYPILKILWKPDVSMLTSSHSRYFTDYVDRFASTRLEQSQDADVERMARVLDLLAHRNPRIRILELGNQNDNITRQFLDHLDADISLRRFSSYTQGSITEEGKLIGYEFHSTLQLATKSGRAGELLENPTFDVLLISPLTSTEVYLSAHLEHLLKYLTKSTTLLFTSSFLSLPPLPNQQFVTLSTIPSDTRSTVTLAWPLTHEVTQELVTECNIILIRNRNKHHFDDMVQLSLGRSAEYNVVTLAFEEISPNTIPPSSIVISTIELMEPVLRKMNHTEMSALKVLTDNASILLWVTAGGLFKSERPDFSLVSGLSRAVMLEQPALKFFTVDVEISPEELEASMKNVLSVLQRAIHDPRPDFEYLQHQRVLHTSRFLPELPMNKTFRDKQGQAAKLMSLREAGHCQLAVKSHGQLETIHFVQRSKIDEDLRPGYVEVQVKFVGLNAKDLHVLNGKVDTVNSTCALEFSGIITRVSSTVTRFTPGDPVVVMAPNSFGTYERVPEWACEKLLQNEKLSDLSTVPMIFSTAIYALRYRANLQQGETILIHSAAGGVGTAAIQIAQLSGAKIFATVGTDAKKKFLVDTFNLDPDHIFSSRDTTFLSGVLAATADEGVDVVLNSLTGDLLHASWQACAESGRFVEIGKRDILDSGKLSMETFKRSTTFTAFDLSTLFYSVKDVHRRTWQELLRSSLQLFREGKLRISGDTNVFDASNIERAFRHFTSQRRIGKTVVSFEDPESSVMVIPTKYSATFDLRKSYIMVGCLGGIGRSLSRWMFGQGARNFVFFGRSGTKNPAAKQLVEDLLKDGAEVRVIHGDSGNTCNVERMIASVESPIGGVVHAAMCLDEMLFSIMTNESWHKSVGPKVEGAWNLHNALERRGDQPDFFLLMSSLTGTVGTATEANYCAANAFLDSFARHRRSLGLPAIALGLGVVSEVGYLHEHPEIEALLVRKGMHAINEDELLQICDIALTTQGDGNGHFADSHILTGMEALGLQKIRKRGFEGHSHVLDDPRAAVIARALEDSNAPNETESKPIGGNLPSAVGKALASSGNGDAHSDSLLESLHSVVAEKLGDLLLLSKEKLSLGTHLSEFGMDSMLAAEFRQFIFHTLHVDVPFLTLLAKTTSVGSLVELLADGLRKGR